MGYRENKIAERSEQRLKQLRDCSSVADDCKGTRIIELNWYLKKEKAELINITRNKRFILKVNVDNIISTCKLRTITTHLSEVYHMRYLLLGCFLNHRLHWKSFQSIFRLPKTFQQYSGKGNTIWVHFFKASHQPGLGDPRCAWKKLQVFKRPNWFSVWCIKLLWEKTFMPEVRQKKKLQSAYRFHSKLASWIKNTECWSRWTHSRENTKAKNQLTIHVIRCANDSH